MNIPVGLISTQRKLPALSTSTSFVDNIKKTTKPHPVVQAVFTLIRRSKYFWEKWQLQF